MRTHQVMMRLSGYPVRSRNRGMTPPQNLVLDQAESTAQQQYMGMANEPFEEKTQHGFVQMLETPQILAKTGWTLSNLIHSYIFIFGGRCLTPPHTK